MVSEVLNFSLYSFGLETTVGTLSFKRSGSDRSYRVYQT